MINIIVLNIINDFYITIENIIHVTEGNLNLTKANYQIEIIIVEVINTF